jgi:kumamolisin
VSVRRRTALRALAIALVLGGLLCAWLLSRASSSPAPPQGRTTAALQLEGSTQIELDLVLRQRSRALQRYLRGLFDPGSPIYGRYLSPAQIGRRFGIDAAASAALERALRARGFRVLELFAQRNLISVSASVANVDRTFDLVLRDHRGPHGLLYREPSRPASIPPALARWVTAVSGLDTDIRATTAALPDASAGALRPIDARTGYDVTPLYAGGANDGRGQTIGVLSIGPYSQRDWDSYAATVKPAGPRPQTVVLSKPSVGAKTEGDLDLEVIHAIAPQAQIIDYETSLDDLPATIMRIIDAGKTSIVSASFGICDGTRKDPFQVPSAYRRAVESDFAAGALSGITFYFATGDTGAYACQQDFAKDTNLSVQFPSDAPLVVAVGGTVLSLNQDGSYAYETGWQDSGSDGGGGGGLNPYDAAPPWEIDVPGVSTGARQTPDVSAAAGGASAWWVYDGSKGTGWEPVYGTSAATPFWAASMLLVNAYMEAHGAGPTCFAAPLLYGVAGESWRYAPFHSVTSGGNRFYQAGPGWNFATGLGSPDVYNLATAAVAYRAQHPLPAGGGACASSLRAAVAG